MSWSVFDPFHDFQSAGYLRNVEGTKDPQRIRKHEAFFFESNLEEAVHFLGKQRAPITYPHFLQVHRILFHEFYPWAGQDRHQLGVGRIVTKGPGIQFELSERSQQAVEWGLRDGNDKECMRRRPGGVMGAFAWGHPFLDGNGRTMLLVHAELCHRAGFAIDWIRSRKNDYLDALTHELAHPHDMVLDTYLSQLKAPSQARENWIDQFKCLPGLDGADRSAAPVGSRKDNAYVPARYGGMPKARDSQETEVGSKSPNSGLSRGRRIGR